MQEIINYLSENIITLALLIGCLGAMMTLNIILGAVMASTSYQFDAKTFFKGVLKALLVALVMLVYCIILELTPLVLSRIDITLPSDLITYIQVVSIVLVAYKKYAKGIYDKLKVLLDVTEEVVETDGRAE